VYATVIDFSCFDKSSEICVVAIQRLQLLLTLVSGLEQICFDLELVSYIGCICICRYAR